MFRNDWRGGMLRKPDSGAGAGGMSGDGSGGQPDGETPPETLTFETWYGKLDAQQRGLFDEHVSGLKTALATERQNRTDLSRQIKDLAAKTEKGSELEKQLTDASQRLEVAERRAAFAEEATRPDVACSNVKAAYALAVAEQLFDRHGRPDWDELKKIAPELFKRNVAGSVDGGAGSNRNVAPDMNTLIRRAAGRR